MSSSHTYASRDLAAGGTTRVLRNKDVKRGKEKMHGYNNLSQLTCEWTTEKRREGGEEIEKDERPSDAFRLR